MATAAHAYAAAISSFKLYLLKKSTLGGKRSRMEVMLAQLLADPASEFWVYPVVSPQWDVPGSLTQVIGSHYPTTVYPTQSH